MVLDVSDLNCHYPQTKEIHIHIFATRYINHDYMINQILSLSYSKSHFTFYHLKTIITMIIIFIRVKSLILKPPWIFLFLPLLCTYQSENGHPLVMEQPECSWSNSSSSRRDPTEHFGISEPHNAKADVSNQHKIRRKPDVEALKL